MEEPKLNKDVPNLQVIASDDKEEKNDIISWIYRNRKALLVGACCVLSYRFGYRAGRAEALSTFDHAIREAKGMTGV